MIDADAFTLATVAEQIAAHKCPGCGEAKGKGHSFCAACFAKLPEPRKHQLKKQKTADRERGHVAALAYLRTLQGRNRQ